MIRRSRCLGVSALVLAVGPVLADGTRDRLREATTIRCVFDLGTHAEWNGGEVTLSSKPVRFGEGGTVTFDSVKLKDSTAGPCDLPLTAQMLGHARMIGNVGAAEVFAMLTTDALSFIETTSAGSVNVTTIFSNYQKPETLAYLAVTSRHVGGVGKLLEPTASQYHGTCEVMP